MSGTVEGLERGVSGTKATLERMHKLVALGKLDPTMQKIATWIRLQVPQDRRGKTTATSDAIFDWASRYGVFQSDPFQIEKIENPVEAMRPIIQARQAGTYKGNGLFIGDCDTFAIMVATLGGVLGFQYAFETAKVDAMRPDEFSHVWTALLVDDDWRALDASTKGATPGWRPPVAPDMFARWPEHPIEDVVKGSDMSSWNGRNGGMGDDEPGGDRDIQDEARNASPFDGVDAEYAADYIGYGIPKDFGSGPGVIPPANFDDLQLLPPYDTQIPAADLQPDMHTLKAAPTLDPSERIRAIDGQPNDHGNPYYRGSGKQPYYKVENQPYPPGSRWNGPVGLDQTRYVRTNKYYQIKSAESPERQVEVQMHQPMLLRRRSVMTKPQRIPYGAMSGMGAIDPETGIMTFDSTPAVAPTSAASSTPASASAAAAGGSVWDSISAAFGAIGKVVPQVMQSNLARTVVNATNRVAGRQVLGATSVTPWYLNPWVLGLGALAIGGGAYVVIKSRPGVRSRRRR